MNTPIQKVPVRDFQHNLSSYLQLARSKPLIVTKYGKDEVIVMNPKQAVNQGSNTQSIDMQAIEDFIGMHKNRKDWQGKTTQEIADELRHNAWYGK